MVEPVDELVTDVTGTEVAPSFERLAAYSRAYSHVRTVTTLALLSYNETTPECTAIGITTLLDGVVRYSSAELELAYASRTGATLVTDRAAGPAA